MASDAKLRNYSETSNYKKYSSAHGQIKNSGDMRDIIGFFRTFVSFMEEAIDCMKSKLRFPYCRCPA